MAESSSQVVSVEGAAVLTTLDQVRVDSRLVVGPAGELSDDSSSDEPFLSPLGPDRRDFATYRLLKPLGQGGMGTVFKALDRAMGRLVAIKFIAPEQQDDPEFRARFQGEMAALGQLDHPGIVRAYAGEIDDAVAGSPFLVMEYVSGSNLEDVVHKVGPLKLHHAEELVRQLAEALASAHAAGVIHRDVKPKNVILTQGGRVKLVDLGIATFGADSEPGATLTGQVIGTPAYLPPERILGTPGDPLGDLYALGCLWFFLLTGESPRLAGPNPESLESRLQRLRPDFHGPARKLLVSLVSWDRNQRPQSARDVVERLTWKPRRIPYSSLGFGVMLVVLVSGISWWGRGNSQAPMKPVVSAIPQPIPAPGPAEGKEVPDDPELVEMAVREQLAKAELERVRKNPDAEVAQRVLAAGGHLILSLPGGKGHNTEIQGPPPALPWTVQEIWLTRIENLPTDVLQYVDRLKSLHTVRLWELGNIDPQLRDLARSRSLRCVSIKHCPFHPNAVNEVLKLDSLVELKLNNVAVTEDALQSVLMPRPSRTLTAVGIQNTILSDTLLQKLTAIPGLKVLDLSGTNVSDQHLASIVCMPSLEILILEETLITDAGLKHLRSSRLSRVLIGGTRLTDAGVSEWLNHTPSVSRLQTLSLAGLPGVGPQTLAAIGRVLTIVDLNLSGTNVSDDDLKALTPLPALTVLDLHRTVVTDAGLRKLPLDRLRLLNVNETHVTARAVNEIRRDHPNLNVESDAR